MKNLDMYVTEKLRIDKNIEVEDVKYILFHKDTSNKPWVAGVHKTLEGVAYYIKRNSSLGAHYVWKCPDELVKEFINKWKSIRNVPTYCNVVKNDIELKNWVEKNKIKEIHSDEINKYLLK